MKHRNKKKFTTRTTPVQQRVENKASLYLLPQEQIVSKEFTGWRGSTTVINFETDTETTLTVSSTAKISAEHGRMFRFATSIARNNEDHRATVSVADILNELGLSNRFENKKKVIKLLEECVGVTIKMESDRYVSIYGLLDGADYDKNTSTITFKVSEKFMEQLPRNKERYINVNRTMKLKGSNQTAIELGAMLQIKGSGVMSGSGEPAPVSNINEAEIVDYLHLNNLSEDDARRTIERAFRSLHDTGGYPQYHRRYMPAFGYVWYNKNPEYKMPKFLKK